jgi:predicted RNA-binding protein associated with RNAse of E/G family
MYCAEHSLLLYPCIHKLTVADLIWQEAFNRTRRILNITVSSSTMYEMPRLLNYITAPTVVSRSLHTLLSNCILPSDVIISNYVVFYNYQYSVTSYRF